MTDESILLREVELSVCTLTLNRPTQYNALSHELLDAIIAALDEIAAENSIRAVVLAASGKAFCAGHDLKQMRQSAEKAEHHALFSKCSEMMQKLVGLPQPVIGKVQGMATAAGCQLVATCDMAIAADTATFAVSGIRVGLFCSTPAVALSRNVSRKRAMEMLMTGEFIDAHTAAEYGLINRTVAAEQLDDAVAELAAKESRALNYTMTKPDAVEGGMAYFERRPPNWSGSVSGEWPEWMDD